MRDRATPTPIHDGRPVRRPAARRPEGVDRRRPRRAVGLLVALVLVAAGCGAPSDPGATPPTTAAPALDEITVEEFETRMTGGDGGLVVNVHVPYEGEIAGTDLLVSYEGIAASPELPTDRAAPLLLYCRSDRMSRSAGRELVAAGYTNVAHLVGGMEAWEASGRTLVHAEPDPVVPGRPVEPVAPPSS